MTPKKIATLISLITLTSFTWLSAADVPIANPPVELTGTKGKFDFIKIDPANNRLLACHTQNGTLDIIDVTTSKIIKSIPTGGAQGIAIDEKGHRYFVSASKPPQLVIIDSDKLEVTGTVTLSGPADLDAYYAKGNRVFVCNDEKPEMWIIDPEAKSILETVTLSGGGMEDLGLDDSETYLYQCLKDSNALVKIDAASHKVLATWKTSPADKPHGLALVPGTETALVVGGTGKLVLMSLKTGEVLSSADIAQKVDEIAFDPELKRVYCASGLGTISVVAVDGEKLTSLAPLPGHQGGHSIAVDPHTHKVWVVFAQDGKAFIQSLAGQ